MYHIKKYYITSKGSNIKIYDVKLQLSISEFSISKITPQHFHIYKNEVNLIIVYAIIIWINLMVQIGLILYFKKNVLEWYITVVTIN